MDQADRRQSALRLVQLGADQGVGAAALHAQEGCHQGQAVLDAVVDLAQQEFLLLDQALVLAQRDGQFGVQPADAPRAARLQHQANQAAGGLDLGGGPGARLAAHLVGPGRKGCARLQRGAGDRGDVLVRVAGPGHDLQLFGAEPHQDRRHLGRHGDGQHAAGDVAIGRRGRDHAFQVGTDKGCDRRRLAHMVGQMAQRRRIGAASRREQLAALNGGKAVGAHQLGQRSRGLREELVQLVVRTKTGQDGILMRAQADALAVQHRLLAQADLAGQAVGQGLAGQTRGQRQVARFGMVAGDKTPQRPVLDDRHRRRCTHPHVAQIMQVHRRDAAQHRIAEVDGLDPGNAAGDRLDRGMHVGDDPHAVAHVEGARLAGNVGCREMVVHERAHALGTAFAHHGPGLVVDEAIDHHPRMAGQLAEHARRVPHQVGQGRCPLQHRVQRLHPAQETCIQRRLIQRGQHLDHHMRTAAIGQQIPGCPVDHHGCQGNGTNIGQIVDCIAQHAAKRLRQGLADHVARQAVGASRRADDPAIARVDDQKVAMRLDRSGNMDRFAVAGSQITGIGRVGQGCGHYGFLRRPRSAVQLLFVYRCVNAVMAVWNTARAALTARAGSGSAA